MRLVEIENNINNRIGENNYFTEAHKNGWFKLGRDNLNFLDWEKITSDKNSRVSSMDANSPERGFESYLLSIGIPSVDKFVESAIPISKNNWSAAYNARTINDYFRRVYGNQSCPHSI